MLLLTLQDLRHRFGRVAIVTSIVTVVFALLFLMNGLVAQFHREPVVTTQSFGADAWVLSTGVSGPFTSSAGVPLAKASSIAAAEVAPLVVARSTLTRHGATREVVLIGHSPERLGAPRIIRGHAVSRPRELVVDRTSGVHVGDEVTIGRTSFHVVGLTSDATVLAGVPLAYVTLGDAQDLAFGSRSVVSGFLARGEAHVTDVDLSLHSNRAVATDTLHPLENAIGSIDLIRALLWAVAIVVVGAIVYLSALDRRRDMAVLKAVGASDARLGAGLAAQAVLIALVAVLVAAVLQRFLRPAFPMRVRVPAADFWRVPLFASLAALAAAGAAIRVAVRTDPALAFAGAGA